MITRIVRLASLCAFLALLSLPASSQSAPGQSEWIKALRDGGYVIIFRHGATYQDQADTDPLNPKNVVKQRQLNDEGRALAKSIGESLHKLRIPVGQVHTSLFQRAMDTGALMGFGDIKVSADYTVGGLVVTPIENNRRTAALRKMAGICFGIGVIALIFVALFWSRSASNRTEARRPDIRRASTKTTRRTL